MELWEKTSCVLCAQNCGLEVLIKNNTIAKVRPDRNNPRSQGYVCIKGMNIANHQHHDDRLTSPLKKTKNGFIEISWDQAFSEIAEKLNSIVKTNGPRSFAYMGGGGQGCHMEAAFGISLLKGLGSQYQYNALAQELTGYFWVCGRLFGRQNKFSIPDEHDADMLLAIGWNGMESHQMPRAPLILREFSKNPDKLLAVIDPRKSETAKAANLHLPIRPGTDALLLKAIISIIINEGWQKTEFIQNHVNGAHMIEPWFKDFNIKDALEVCELKYEDVYSLCRELSTRKWCVHMDLGVHMNRHSTVVAYLVCILVGICGRALVPGGNIIPGSIVPLGSHTDERNPKTWRTVKTGYPAIDGAFPPNVMPEEILNDHPERLRAVITCGSNPLRSYADTAAYEKAFKELELLVTIELAMTETAQLSDYVLPARSGYESWDTTFFSWNFPEVFFHMRRPVVEPAGHPLECGEIFTGIADAAGLIPDIPGYVYKAAKKNRYSFAMALFSYLKKNPKYMKYMVFIIAKTLGKEMGSFHKSAIWALLLASPDSSRKNFKRAGYDAPLLLKSAFSEGKIFRAIYAALKYRSIAPLGVISPKIAQSEKIYNALIEHPEGLWVAQLDRDKNIEEVKHRDGKIDVYIPELADWITGINAESERKALEPDKDFPFILNAGRHTKNNANTLMRNPEWIKNKRACTAAMHPDDAALLTLKDGQTVRVVTEAGSGEIELEITEDIRKGQVIIPHGFGLNHNGETCGLNVNRLTKNTHRDRIAATPYHRYVPCRIETV